MSPSLTWCYNGVMRRFQGSRPHPPQGYVERGISDAGVAPDFEGVVFSDGTVVVRWLTEYRSHSVWVCWDDFYHVHGHPEYGTVITWLDSDGGESSNTCWSERFLPDGYR